MDRMESESELVARAKDGNDAAFAELVRRYLPIVYSFLKRYGGDETLAEDAAQETFVKAWRNLGRFDTAKSVKPWLLQIARNSANDIFRKSRATPFSRLFATRDENEQGFEDMLADDAPLPPELFERREIAEEMTTALQALPERDRAVLLLRYEDELSFEEIGRVLRSPMNTVKSWHRRALARLRSLLEKSAPERHDRA